MGDRGSAFLRFLDRFGGIPLIFLIGLFRKKHTLPSGPWDRIGILATAAIGDTILLSAVINDLQKVCSETKVTLFVGESNYAISRMVCRGLEIVSIPVSNPFKAVRIIQSLGEFDLWLDFGPWPRVNAVITAFVHARYTAGFLTGGQHRHFAYDGFVVHSGAIHEIDNLRRLVSLIGIQSSSLPSLGEYSRPEIKGDYLVIHMFPGGYKSSYKEWKTSNWIFLINELTDKGIKVIVTGAGKDRQKAEAVCLECNNREMILNRAGKMNLEETAAYLEHARLVVSVNTGIMHLAAAAGVPLIALHGPANVNRWGPLSDRAVNFTASSPSAGCLNLGFEYDWKDKNSLDTVDPEKVLITVMKMWESQ